MARSLIVGCGCRGRELGTRLVAAGWQVRGTTRDPKGADAIEAAGIEAAIADPGMVATILDQVADVAIIIWLMGSARAEPEAVAAIHGPRLERVMEEIVDTPVRGFVYEAAGGVQPEHLEHGSEVVRAAGERYRIPVEIVDADPGDAHAWTVRMLAAAERLVGG